MYSDEFIEKVRSNSDLKRVFEAKGITLKKSGADLVCKCPFHSDKNPSLHVNLERGLWNCFGCGEGGDAIQFVRRAYGYSFREAIEYLANTANIPIEREEPLTEAQIQEQQKREVLLNAMDVAVEYYVSTLWSEKNDEAKKAMEQAIDRWDKEFLQSYRVGYATFEWDNHFKRITLVNNAKTERLTIDRELSFHNTETGLDRTMDNLVVIEVKRDGNTFSPIQDLLRELRIFPCGFSKYCIDMALTTPGIKRNLFNERIGKIEKLTSICY